MTSRPIELPTGTITFLFTDIEGSTRIVQDVGPDRFRDALEQHQAILRGAFGARGGVERGTQGDSFAVVFTEAPAAVGAAVDAQRALVQADWPPGALVRVRMGLHTGVATAGGDDYVGLDIHRAARIAAVAHGGQTLLSEATHALVSHDLPAGTLVRDLGRHRLKDLAHPEHLFEIAIDGLTPEFPSLRSGASQGNLPARLTSFVGRERDLGALGALLRDARLVTLTGPGGIGKTSLALELARRVADEFPDGAWLVRLEAVDDGELVAPTIVDALGVRDAGARTHERRLAEHLADRQLLLLLDNLEQVRGAGVAVAALLEAAPGLRLVATSRSPLGVGAEQLYPVAPLPLPASDAADPLAPSEAVQLFVDRARRARPAYDPDLDERRLIVAICRRVDGLPLGIELAAAGMRLLPTRAILDRLERTLDLPGAAPADLPERQRTLRSTIAWSHDLLDEPARRLLARLSVFVGGSRLEEAEAIPGPADELGTDPLTAIAELVDQSLLLPRSGVDGPRFAMLDTIREFARERLVASGDDAGLRRRHALAYLALAEAEAVHLPGRDQVVRLTRMTEDHDNLRAAIAWAIEAADPDLGLRLVTAMWRFWQLRGHLDEGATLSATVLAIPGAERDDRLRMRAVEAAGGVAYWRGDHAKSIAFYEDQIRIARAIGDRIGEADGLFNVAHLLGWDAADTSAGTVFAHAAALYRSDGDARGEARTEWSRTLAEMATAAPSEVAAALPRMERQLELFEGLDDTMFVQTVTGTLAWLNMMLGDLPAAVRWGERSLRATWESGDVANATFALRMAAGIAVALGRHAVAAELMGAFEANSKRYAVQPPPGLAVVLARFETAATARAHLDEATFTAAHGSGSRLGLDEATALALDLAHSPGPAYPAENRS